MLETMEGQIDAVVVSTPNQIHIPASVTAMTETVLLGNVAYRLGQEVQWDAENLKALDCAEADQYLRREYRDGWAL